MARRALVVVFTGFIAALGVDAMFATPKGYSCEELSPAVQVRWKIAGADLKVELLGKIRATDYMAFGPSGSESSSQMTGSDPVVVDFFRGSIRARDFYITSRTVCRVRGKQGVCPDENFGAKNSVRGVSGVRSNELGLTLARFTRPLRAADSRDSRIANKGQFISWAVGEMGSDGIPRRHDRSPAQTTLNLGRSVKNNCRSLTGSGSGGSVNCKSLIDGVVRQSVKRPSCNKNKIRNGLDFSCKEGICKKVTTKKQCVQKLTNRVTTTLLRKFC